MDIIEIKKKFENQSIRKRIDFIEDYDFKNDPENREYFIGFIKNVRLTNNIWYTIWLIDLAAFFEIKDNNLLERYLGYLIAPGYYLLKLTVLDYVSYTYTLYKKDSIDYSSVQFVLTNKYDKKIVKNEALLTLMLLYPIRKDLYMLQLKRSLKQTIDYRSHVRVFNFFLSRDVDSIIPKSFIKE